MKVIVLPGDGIGPEVVDASLPIIDALALPWTLEFGDLGWDCRKTEGNPVPERTWNLIAAADAALVGAVTSKPAKEARQELDPRFNPEEFHYVSPVIQLRQRLELFANIRPVNDMRGSHFHFVVIRENTEGLYAGIDFRETPPSLWPHVNGHRNAIASGRERTAVSLRLQMDTGVRRILEFAFGYTEQNEHQRLTLADKPNVLRGSSELVLEIFEEASLRFPNIEAEILNVDAVGLWLVTRPERFGVIVAENMFGDILSDVGAGIMGGLGLASSGNIGIAGAYFEPVHGSAPSLTGKQRANPMAMILTIAQMARRYGFREEAQAIEAAVRRIVAANRQQDLTYDLGGRASTSASARAVIGALK